jgi:Asp-tRNA(Asn)/Glu-tRNA(Gln) amidotransferase A subunit family amidase
LRDELISERSHRGGRLLKVRDRHDSATAVQWLIDAGAVPIGKTNMDQFATGWSDPSGEGRSALARCGRSL